MPGNLKTHPPRKLSLAKVRESRGRCGAEGNLLAKGRRAGGGGALLGNAFGMAVEAFDEVNVVRAFGRGESGIHLFDIEAAIGEARMTSGAGRASVLAVFLMAR